MKKLLAMGMLLWFLALPAGGLAGVYTFEPGYFSGEYSDLQDLDHYYYYTWYMADSANDGQPDGLTDVDRILDDLAAGEEIVSASLTFENIRNHDDSDFDLYVHLLQDVPNGDAHNDVDWGSDNAGGGDYFVANAAYYGDEELLVHYYADFEWVWNGTSWVWDVVDEGATHDPDGSTINMPYYPNAPATVTYSFGAGDLATLTSFLADGTLGLGFDPDCHFYNDGVYLTINTGSGGSGGDPVPEPATALMLGLGLIGLAGWRRRRTAA